MMDARLGKRCASVNRSRTAHRADATVAWATRVPRGRSVSVRGHRQSGRRTRAWHPMLANGEGGGEGAAALVSFRSTRTLPLAPIAVVPVAAMTVAVVMPVAPLPTVAARRMVPARSSIRTGGKADAANQQKGDSELQVTSHFNLQAACEATRTGWHVRVRSTGGAACSGTLGIRHIFSSPAESTRPPCSPARVHRGEGKADVPSRWSEVRFLRGTACWSGTGEPS